MIDNVRQDAVTTSFTSKLEKFARDLVFNADGQPDLWIIDDSLHQLHLMLVPMLKSHLENIPIDRIEMTSAKYDIVLEDLLFSGTDILPDHLEFKFQNRVKVNLQDIEQDVSTHNLKLTVDKIKPTLHNLKFYYKKKTGFPKIEDYGIVDVVFKGDGMALTLLWELLSSKGQPPTIQLVSTKCTIHSLGIHFVKEKTKHDIIDRLFVRLLNSTIKKRIANAVAEYIQMRVTQIDNQINQFFITRPIEKLKMKADAALKQFTKKFPIVSTAEASKTTTTGGHLSQIPLKEPVTVKATTNVTTVPTEIETTESIKLSDEKLLTSVEPELTTKMKATTQRVEEQLVQPKST